MSVFSWFGQMWSSLVAVADMSEPTTATEPEPVGCEIFTDALDQLTDELDRLCERIDFNLDRLWECRKQKAMAESVGTEDPRLQRLATTDKNVNGAKLLLTTAANRVRQVVDEIEIVTRQDMQ